MLTLTTVAGRPVSDLIIGGKEDLSQSEPALVSAAFERGVNAFCECAVPAAAWAR